MTRLTALDLTPFYRSAIGVDRLFDRIVGQLSSTTNDNYPPYNIVTTGENTYEVQVAVAGFKQGEVNIEVKENTLIITGEKAETELPAGHSYDHHGISNRRFIRTFAIADYVEVKSASAKDGILTVSLERIIPEALQPKTIAIAYES